MVWIESLRSPAGSLKKEHQRTSWSSRELAAELRERTIFFLVPESNGTDGLNKLEGTTLYCILVLAIIISWSGKRPTDRLMPNYHK